MWSGYKLYLLLLALFILAHYPMIGGRGKSGMYISNSAWTFRLYLISMGLKWPLQKGYKIEVHWKRSVWWFSPLSAARPLVMGFVDLMLLQTTAETGWLAPLPPSTPPPLHSDVSRTQWLTQHYSHS